MKINLSMYLYLLMKSKTKNKKESIHNITPKFILKFRSNISLKIFNGIL